MLLMETIQSNPAVFDRSNGASESSIARAAVPSRVISDV